MFSYKKKIVLLFFSVLVVLNACNKRDIEVKNDIEETTIDEKTLKREEKIKQYTLNSISDRIEHAKVVTEYTSDTLVDDMDSIVMGQYNLYNDDVEKDYIEWLILEKQNDKALLVSKYIIDNKSYNTEDVDTTWESSNLRKWLNDDFFMYAFDDEEKNQIVSSIIYNDANERWDTKGGNDTMDKIFCLSVTDVLKYFGQENMLDDNKKLATYATEYAQSIDNNGKKLWVLENYPDWFNNYSSYYLRTPGVTLHETSVVSHYGYLNTYGVQNISKNIGVRPAMWVKYK